MSAQAKKCTRPSGYMKWAPYKSTQALLRDVDQVLSDYRDHLPLTVRQIYYRLIGGYGYAKGEPFYNRVVETVGKARRSRRISFESIRDDGAVDRPPSGFDDPLDFWRCIEHSANNYHRVLSQGQPCAIEIWVEAAGMVPQAERVASEYGATVYSNGGFNSLTVKYEAARRMAQRERPTVALHVGDLDASGMDIYTSACEDIAAFLIEWASPNPIFERVAVTEEQIEEFGLTTEPLKEADYKKGMRYRAQAEALTPKQLADALHATAASYYEITPRRNIESRSARERNAIVAAFSNFIDQNGIPGQDV